MKKEYFTPWAETWTITSLAGIMLGSLGGGGGDPSSTPGGGGNSGGIFGPP